MLFRSGQAMHVAIEIGGDGGRDFHLGRERLVLVEHEIGREIEVIQQIANQLNKLVDVVSVADMTRGEHLERELVLLKLRLRPADTDAVRGHVIRAGGRVLEPSPEAFIVELTASEAEINTLIHDLGSRAEIVEVVRSGALGIGAS